MLLLLGASTAPPPTAQDVFLSSIDASFPVIGPTSVANGPLETAQELELLSIDASNTPDGLSIYGIPLDPETPPDPFVASPPALFVPSLVAELRTSTGALLSKLTTQQGVSFDSALNEVGAGSLTLQLDDPDASLVLPGRHIWNRIDGEVVFIWVIERPPTVVPVTEGEEAEEKISVAGQGIASILGRAVTFPTYPKFADPLNASAALNPQHRLFNFASYELPAARVLTWPKAVTQGVGGVGVQIFRRGVIEYITDFRDRPDSVENVRVPAPYQFPMPEAKWIWGNDDPSAQIGYNYFRTEFVITGDTFVKIACSGDNFYTLYLDGTPMLGEDENRECWQEWREIDLILPAGTYVLAMVVYNAPLPQGGFNPGGAVFAVAKADTSGEVIPDEPYLAASSADTRCIPYPVVQPGFTPGEIIGGLINEAKLRGHLTTFLTGFTDTHDSNGAPWPFVPNYSIRAGATILEALDVMVQDGIADWRVNPVNRKLELYNYKTLGQNSTVAYAKTGNTATQNLVELSFNPEGIVYNRWLVRWSKGYFTIQDAASRAALGFWVEGMMSVDAETIEQAEEQAEFLMSEQLDISYAAVADVDPLGPDDRPFVAFNVGDSVTAPDRFGVQRMQRVYAISVTQDELGRPLFGLDLNKRQGSELRDERKLIQSLGRSLTGDTTFRNTKLAFTDGVKI